MNANAPEDRHVKDARSAKTVVETAVARHPFLRSLRPEYLRTLAENAIRVHYDPGELIFRAGDPANRFYLIEQGEVALEYCVPGKEPCVVHRIGPGDVLGWSWLFPPYTWSFDARATKDITAIFFYGTRLRERCEEDPGLGYELMKRMTQVAIQRLQATRHELLALRH